jgi:hypothetical protein
MCWTYNRGRCAIFGCGSLPRSAASREAEERRSLPPVTIAGTLIALVGLFPLSLLWSFAREGGSLATAFVKDPAGVIFDVAMAGFPVVWGLVVISRSPRVRRITAACGALLFCAWGIVMLNGFSRRDVYRREGSAGPFRTCTLRIDEERGRRYDRGSP